MNIFKKKTEKQYRTYSENYESKKLNRIGDNLIVGLVIGVIGGLAYLIQTYYPVFLEYVITFPHK